MVMIEDIVSEWILLLRQLGMAGRFELIHDRYHTGHKPDSRAISAWSRSKCLPRVFPRLIEVTTACTAKPHDCTNFKVDHATRSAATAEVVLCPYPNR
jgi:hypothetical protein